MQHPPAVKVVKRWLWCQIMMFLFVSCDKNNWKSFALPPVFRLHNITRVLWLNAWHSKHVQHFYSLLSTFSTLFQTVYLATAICSVTSHVTQTFHPDSLCETSFSCCLFVSSGNFPTPFSCLSRPRHCSAIVCLFLSHRWQAVSLDRCVCRCALKGYTVAGWHSGLHSKGELWMCKCENNIQTKAAFKFILYIRHILYVLLHLKPTL